MKTKVAEALMLGKKAVGAPEAFAAEDHLTAATLMAAARLILMFQAWLTANAERWPGPTRGPGAP